jgi:hypothetical protein
MTAILKVDTIQDTSGNNIINENANTITIGKSGDTVNLAAGSSLTSPGLTLSDNILFDTANKGIYLGTTSATASNLLDDYEEGTWTPSFVIAPSGTVTSLTGTYTKVGRIVTLSMRVEGTSLNAPSYMRVTGMPFSVSYFGTGTYIIGGINSRVHGWTFLTGSSEWYWSPSGTVSAASIDASVTYYTT